MAGNVTTIRNAGQVTYRLAGDAEASADQVAYRLGEQADSREVFWIGDGATASVLGVVPGASVTPGDEVRVRALLDGVNPATGEQLVKPKQAMAESAKLAAVPAYDAIVTAAAERGLDAAQLFVGPYAQKRWADFQRQVQAKGDAWRVPLNRLEAIASDAGMGRQVEAAYSGKVWAAAQATKDVRVDVGTKGYDVGLTLSKRASLALVMEADPDKRARMVAIAQECAAETYRALGARVAYGATGHHGGGQAAVRVEGTGWAGTATMEVTSRDGDPHVHFHSMIANLTICEDGKARTIGSGGRDVLAHGAWASELFRLLYAQETAAAGLAEWGFNPVTQEWDQNGISADAAALASKRHQAIKAEAEQFGEKPSKGIDATAERITRKAKSQDTETLDQVATRFGAELDEAGVDLHGTDGLEPVDVAAVTQGEWNIGLDQVLTANNAVFTRVKAEQAVMRLYRSNDPGWKDAVNAIVDGYLERGDTVAAVDTGMSDRLTGGQRYTTQEMLDCESVAYSVTVNGLGRGNHVVGLDAAQMALDAYQVGEGFEFNPGQRDMFFRWVCGGNQVDLVVGAAGTGKTASADAARYVWEANGLKVLGISTAGLAAQNLGAATGVQVRTAASLVNAIEHDTAPAVDVLIWDEMGMASNREQGVILAWAASNEIDVRGMGDPKQMDSVGAGSTFAKQCEQVNAIELTENMRQNVAADREAVAQLRAGDAAGALAVFGGNGQITVTGSQTDKVAGMAAAWAVAGEETSDPIDRLKTSVMITPTHAVAEQLHAHAREHARARGWVNGPDVEYRGTRGVRTWAVGEPILMRRNDRGKKDEPPVFNGQRGIIRAINPDRSATVEWIDASGERQLRTFTPDYLAEHTASGCALTIHAAQGQTMRHVQKDGDGGSLNDTYTGLTRHTHTVHVWNDLTSLDIHGKERATVMAMPLEQRTAHVIGLVARHLEQTGWQQSETAHDATATPVPMPEPPEQAPQPSSEPGPPDTRPRLVREAFPNPIPVLTTQQPDMLLTQQAAGTEADLAAAPRRDRPDWKRTDTEIKAEVDQLRATVADVDTMPAKQAALDAAADQLRATAAEHDRLKAEVVDRANDNARFIAANVETWRVEAEDLVTQAEAPLRDAWRNQREKTGKRFGQKAAAREVEAAQQQLANTFPATGHPGDYFLSQDWHRKAVAETIERLHGHEAEHWRTSLATNDRELIDAMAQQRQLVNDELLAQLPRADYEPGTNGDWHHQARRPSGHKQTIETGEQRWQTADPDALVHSAESMAIELEARHKDTAKALDLASRRIETQQTKLNQIPQAAAVAQQRLSALTAESSIREAQPQTHRQIEETRRQEARAKAAAQREQLREAEQQRQRNHYQGPTHGPSQGHGRSM